MAQAIAPSGGAGGFDLSDLQGDRGRHRKERIIKGLFLGAAVLSVVISVMIVLSLVGEAFSFITNVDPGALFADGWFPRRGQFDILTIFFGTLLVTAIAMLVATPLGLGAAVYLAEYARPRTRRILKPILEMLAGIPSIVFGYFALTWISPKIVNSLFPSSSNFNLLAAGLAVGLLVTPLVASVSEDALRAVPLALREASYGLGARKRTTTVKVVFPAAVSGVVAALIVGISRAVGETMVVAMASGATGGSLRSMNVLEPGQTMTAAMAALATGSDQVQGNSNAVSSLFFVGLLLFLMTLLLNVASERFVRRVRQKY